jgi:hypothetical protein
MPTRPQSLDAIALLKADHRVVEDLFERFEKASGKTAKEKIAKQVCLELMVHATIEEEVFYPAIKGVVEDDAKVLIAEILEGSEDDEFFDAKVKVLSEMIKHHVKEEEQRDGMFAQAKKGDVDLEALGAALAVKKQDVIKQFSRDGIPAPKTRSMKGADLERGEPVEA